MRIEHARIVAVPTTSYRFKRLVIEQNNEFNRHVAELSVFSGGWGFQHMYGLYGYEKKDILPREGTGIRLQTTGKRIIPACGNLFFLDHVNSHENLVAKASPGW